jgi:hypothetical protein
MHNDPHFADALWSAVRVFCGHCRRFGGPAESRSLAGDKALDSAFPGAPQQSRRRGMAEGDHALE